MLFENTIIISTSLNNVNSKLIYKEHNIITNRQRFTDLSVLRDVVKYNL